METTPKTLFGIYKFFTSIQKSLKYRCLCLKHLGILSPMLRSGFSLPKPKHETAIKLFQDGYYTMHIICHKKWKINGILLPT